MDRQSYDDFIATLTDLFNGAGCTTTVSSVRSKVACLGVSKTLTYINAMGMSLFQDNGVFKITVDTVGGDQDFVERKIRLLYEFLMGEAE